jgi:glycosyltransferase involved in cell wall biosynthesis
MQLVLVGEGPERERLTALARELGIDSQVVFAGRRPSAPSFHWLFDISVLASRQEGFPNSIVEAMAAGRPVIATRVGGVPDAVVHGETGLLVSADSADEMAGALVQLARDHARRQQLGAMGAQRARSRYAASLVIAQLERLYEQLAHRTIAM